MDERNISIAKTIANDIIIPDPAPEWMCYTFLDKYDQLEPIFIKDSARCFLRLFKNWKGYTMSWNLTITAQTLTCMVSFNSLRCAKVVLEGRAPELLGVHANPNCVTKYGYFPLHEAAERFSIEMIKLLLRHGASANVRTVGDDVIDGLLLLHIAIENTCLHKYLEDNLSPGQDHLDYIYKLFHLLCLPEMKIFLDTTRLLAGKTNNLLEELWNYIENGKLIQTAILLLAAQEQIRGGCSSKINGSRKKNGYDIMYKRILRLSFALRWGKVSNGMTQKLMKEKRALIDCMGLLVDAISHAGEPLSAYIQAHSEAPHVEVLEHVSTILKEYGFCPTEEVMDTINLQPYDCKMSETKSCSKGFTDANTAVAEMANLHAADKKAGRKEVGRGWDPTYTRRNFFPYWRSILRTRCPVKVYPTYARADARSGRDLEQIRAFESNSSMAKNRILGSVGRIPSLLASNHQSKRSFSTAATGAFRLLKLLK
ncbi:uncharacterized protein [Oryza sativa Japonica Group]|uniref:cDNA clone:J033119G22, full insert sequence n=3 Tax=Oryza sativa subsp. japonica TaxID=39947 RepID=Q0D632_ORYSJ|nr:uncharacterized protein LOC4343375 [Oryza sativa Japonica Group]XP_015645295.1 uncharacterized protein LOC4343375 [Oryza sativa Japonica Group]KAF2923045.1 hypothetical protein DAI22_07g161200 [Oryza sativa Japonica Group]KAF2923046.1 hypothetical protein DAI22_07g161200 [Oryza sativa Japonica Group]BAF21691.2 Os07g0515700 [Oryza sativa Japonica Group]BAG95899.1 unnamed protein product [Oryza sativa Japonica Group]|eukprot:NP_001059777.2 Os07g0515700 [Oryza sativa Japonica Group]